MLQKKRKPGLYFVSSRLRFSLQRQQRKTTASGAKEPCVVLFPSTLGFKPFNMTELEEKKSEASQALLEPTSNLEGKFLIYSYKIGFASVTKSGLNCFRREK